MQKILKTQKEIPWLPKDSIAETYLTDELPPLELCSSAYAIVIKDGALLMTDLREGERPTRTLDIPGGHSDAGETPDATAVRETFEETGVRVKISKLAACQKITIIVPKPEAYRYPYPVSYMLYYLCDVVEETAFAGNAEVHGRVWLPLDQLSTCPWYLENKVMMDEILAAR